LVEQTLLSEPVVDEPVAEESVAEESVAEEPVAEEPAAEEPVAQEPAAEEPAAEEPAAEESLESMPPPQLADAAEHAAEPAAEPVVEQPRPQPASSTPAAPPTDTDEAESEGRSPLGPIAGALGLACLAISVLLAVGALLVALGVDSGVFYQALEAVANVLVGPLNHAFDFSGANAERKEHFIAWGAGSIGYLVLSFVGQAVQRANTDEA